ncbi:unnamed protein product [Urochloa humidicola]
MVSKTAVAATLLLLVLLAGHGEAVYAAPLRDGLSLGWMNGLKGGSPPALGMQPSSATVQPPAGGQKGYRSSIDEEKSVGSGPNLFRPTFPSPP